MKKRLAYALITLLVLTGCASASQTAEAAGSTPASPSAQAEREPMSIEEAGTYYLKHVCLVNTVVYEFNDLYLAAYAEAEAGGSPSLASLIEVTARMREAHQGLADAFSEKDILWPAVLEDEIDPFINDQYDGVASLAALANAKSTDQFFDIMAEVQRKDAESDGAAIVRTIRAKLDLLADPEKSCKNYIDS
jgi:uncharacterized lipoprotein YmbA